MILASSMKPTLLSTTSMSTVLVCHVNHPSLSPYVPLSTRTPLSLPQWLHNTRALSRSGRHCHGRRCYFRLHIDTWPQPPPCPRNVCGLSRPVPSSSPLSRDSVVSAKLGKPLSLWSLPSAKIITALSTVVSLGVCVIGRFRLAYKIWYDCSSLTLSGVVLRTWAACCRPVV
jgi:hypothetical protein